MNNYKKHLNKLKAIQQQDLTLSLYDLEQGIFDEEIEAGEVVCQKIMKHKFKSHINKKGFIVKANRHQHAYDYIIDIKPCDYDRAYTELMVATVYIEPHSHLSKKHRETYRDNPLYDQRYGISRIELYCVKYNNKRPANGLTVTQFKI